MDKGIDDIADWRMLEYWMQVELYRAIQSGTGGSWRHIGDYEHPYFTDHPKSGAKTNTKWIHYYSVNLKLHRQIALHG